MPLFTKQAYYMQKSSLDLIQEHLRAKTTRKTPERVTMNSITYLLERLLEQQGYVPLAVDVMYINENLFSYDHVNNPTIWYS